VDHFHGRLPGYIGSGTKRSCFVHVDDVVVESWGRWEGDPREALCTGGENSSIVEVFELVQNITGRPPPRLHIPIWAAKVIGFLSCPRGTPRGPVPIFTNKVSPRTTPAVQYYTVLYCACVRLEGWHA